MNKNDKQLLIERIAHDAWCTANTLERISQEDSRALETEADFIQEAYNKLGAVLASLQMRVASNAI